MTKRDERIHDEAVALWRELFGDRPPVRADGAAILEVITRSLPEQRYERIVSPHLRPSQFSPPRSAPG